MNRPMPDHITDGPADNWPGDKTAQDWQEERERKCKNLSRDAIRDMVADAMDDELCDIIKRHVIMHTPKVPEQLVVGTALSERITNALEEYLEADE